MTTDDLRRLALAAPPAERHTMILALLDERDRMQRVIDAAKAMRARFDIKGLLHEGPAFDTALAALEQEGK